MKIPFNLIMMNSPVNSNPFNPPEGMGSWIPTHGVPLLLTLRTPEGYNFLTAECPAPKPEKLESTFFISAKS